MVEFEQNGNQTRLVLTPNKSMTWETNKKILFGMFIVSMMIGLSFASIGAWVVLPFAGLEISLVGIAMYYVCWKLNFKHIISIESQSLIFQKGVYFPKHEWHWRLDQTQLLKQSSNYRMSAPSLFLKNLNETIEVGDFLNRNEKKVLREHFRSLGVPIIEISK